MADLSDEDIQFIKELREAKESGKVSRRDAIALLGGVGAGALAGGAGYSAMGSAKADASTSDSDGNVGAPNDPVDVFAEGIANNGTQIDLGDSLVPDTDASYDLGSSSNSFNNLYSSNAEVELVSTDELTNVADYIIGTGDDAATIIEGMARGEVAYLAPGGSWDLTATLDVTAGVALVGSLGGGQAGEKATFVKQFNGTMATVRQNSTFIGLAFDGNRANYSGDGVVDASNGVNSQYWERCHIKSMSGDARVMDGHYFSIYDSCRFSDTDGCAVRHIQTGSSEVSQNTFRGRTQFSRCAEGSVNSAIIYDDVFMHDDSYVDIVAASNTGDFMYVRADTHNLTVRGNVSQNDGAAFVFDERSDATATVQQTPDIRVRTSNNWAATSNTNVASAGTRTRGLIQVQGTTAIDGMEAEGRVNPGTNEQVPVSDYGDRRSRFELRFHRFDNHADDVRISSATDSVSIYCDITNDTVANSGAGTGVVYRYGAGGVTEIA